MPPAFSVKMLSHEFYEETHPDYYENKLNEEIEQKICITDICIPKIEPYSNISRLDEDILNTSELIRSPIPFIVPYKIKDPIVVLERCDKIWETLQLIKNAQNKRHVNSSNELLSKQTNSSSYIKYQPVLTNDNTALPDFVFSVKTKKKLFQCSTCGKLYTKNITLRLHQAKIHNISMSPLRSRNSGVQRRSIDKDSDREKEKRNGREKELERETNVNEKEKRDHEQVYSKRNENTFPGVSSQSTTLSPTQYSIFNHKRSKTRTNVSVQSKNNINDNEILQKKQGKRISNIDLQQNEKQISSHHDPTFSTCLLCKEGVKDIRKHLIDYHKIESSDFMLKELEKTSPRSKFEKLNNTAVKDKSLKECETVQKHSRVQEKVKRKASVSPTDSRKKCKTDNNDALKDQFRWREKRRECDVCHNLYTKSSYYKHTRNHRKRGETKENFHLFKDKYLKYSSRFRLRGSPKLNDVPNRNTNSTEHKDKNNSSASNKKEVTNQTLENFSKEKERCGTNSNSNRETRCSCGKLFHNSHTLSMHKKNCNSKNKTCTTEHNLNESVPHNEKSGCDKDPGPGISITIKKKNNSYEIVDKDNENENEDRLQDSNRSKRTEISDISRNNVQVKSGVQSHDSESSKYSRYHSVIKLQPVEEDVDIDIENVLQTKSCKNNIIEMNESVNDLNKKEEATRKINSVGSQKDNSKQTNEKVLQSEQPHTNKFNSPKKYICVCGSKFYNRKAFDVHIDKHQSDSGLKCGYCKTDFADVNAWNKHGCSVKFRKKFFDVPQEIICYACNTTVQTHKQLDEHVKLEHYDSTAPYQCFGCCKRFASVWLRRTHFAAEHSLSICSICKAKVQTISNTKSKHEGYHYGLGFPCHLCKKAYSDQSRLFKHNVSVHDKIPNETVDTTNQSLQARNKLGKKLLIHLNKNIELES